jgi:hypothetical protein
MLALFGGVIVDPWRDWTAEDSGVQLDPTNLRLTAPGAWNQRPIAYIIHRTSSKSTQSHQVLRDLNLLEGRTGQS